MAHCYTYRWNTWSAQSLTIVARELIELLNCPGNDRMAGSRDSDISHVVDNIYIGPERAVHRTDELKQNNVTHILSINNVPLHRSVTEKYNYKFVYGMDLEFTDLLSHFEECFHFIEDASDTGGSVLVHCMMGCSRSATIVIAYLMNKNKATYEESLELVKGRRPMVCPNEGFVSQLLLFEEMGCVIDRTHEKYRQYKLKQLATKLQGSTPEERSKLQLDYFETAEEMKKDAVVFKCRKCRHSLFKQSGILKHTVGDGEVAFDWRGKVSSAKVERADDQEEKLCDLSYFIEPVRWMAKSVQELEGKLNCPKCSCKIGSFIWYGERCPCGAWVAPAFHIQTAKVDMCKPRIVPTR
ncbi:dual specificity protein phosphatase 12-like isoform X1 [Ostrea edulis]|uniref:dual specificity protein phosphatase 12-like isoform X1 n=2 Tax=Ostrea edulis TaxID=37623 RepID=UPI0020957A1E|nr:dual specificity protein phosphatase 12-like isoform X1 [Ostrea edulis]